MQWKRVTIGIFVAVVVVVVVAVGEAVVVVGEVSEGVCLIWKVCLIFWTLCRGRRCLTMTRSRVYPHCPFCASSGPKTQSALPHAIVKKGESYHLHLEAIHREKQDGECLWKGTQEGDTRRRLE
jgi:hypothetical protein